VLTFTTFQDLLHLPTLDPRHDLNVAHFSAAARLSRPWFHSQCCHLPHSAAKCVMKSASYTAQILGVVHYALREHPPRHELLKEKEPVAERCYEGPILVRHQKTDSHYVF